MKNGAATALLAGAVTLGFSMNAAAFDDVTLGTVLGGVAGGAIGHAITGGSTVGTIAGTLGGAYLGNRIPREHERRYYYRRYYYPRYYQGGPISCCFDILRDSIRVFIPSCLCEHLCYK